MDRTDNEPSISPSPESDTTNSVQTIIAKHDQNTKTTIASGGQHSNPAYLNSQIAIHLENDNDTGHLYNTPDLITTNTRKPVPNADKEKPTPPKTRLHNTEININSQNPNVNSVPNGAASASSSVTLITTPNQSKLPVNVWLGTVQLLLSVALTALGGLVLARAASLSNTGSGIWAGGICGITGALGVINVQRAQTGFLAVSLICVASSTLAIALTGIGLVRDYNVVNIF